MAFYETAADFILTTTATMVTENLKMALSQFKRQIMQIPKTKSLQSVHPNIIRSFLKIYYITEQLNICK